jgi:hypothetical protein
MALRVERRRIGLLASCVLAVPVLVLVLAQAFLPTLAAHRVRARMARYGRVSSVSVKAFPAIKLLWGRADSVKIRADALSVPSNEVAKLLWEGHDITDITVSASTATLTALPNLSHGLTVSDARTEKRGSAVDESATITQRQLDEALPPGFHIEPLASAGGGVEARASGGLFGVQASITALVKPLEGRLVAEPRGFPLASLATVTLFYDPHLKVESVDLRVLRSQPLTYGLTMRASLS